MTTARRATPDPRFGNPAAPAVGQPPPRIAAIALAALIGSASLAGCAARDNLVDSMPRPEDEARLTSAVSPVAPSRPPAAAGPHYVPRSPNTATLGSPAPARAPAPAARPAVAPASALTLPVGARPWRWIVIHHSATAAGNAVGFDAAHRKNGWDELGYHFVVDNGRGGRDGSVEVGPRWAKQKQGAHAKTPDNRYNDFGIGVCLVGNFDEERPSRAQVRSTAALVANLMAAYNIPPERVIGHRDTKSTNCPGRHCDVGAIRREAVAALNAAGGPPRASVADAGDELLSSR